MVANVSLSFKILILLLWDFYLNFVNLMSFFLVTNGFSAQFGTWKQTRYGFLSLVSKTSALSTVTHCFLPWSLELTSAGEAFHLLLLCAHFSLLMAITLWWYFFFPTKTKMWPQSSSDIHYTSHRGHQSNKTYFPLFPAWKPVSWVTFSCGKKNSWANLHWTTCITVLKSRELNII